MKENQVVKIRPDGSAYALDYKKKGLDLRRLGKTVKKRISDIEFSVAAQKHYICVRDNDLDVPTGNLSYRRWSEFTNGQMPEGSTLSRPNPQLAILMFEEYEQAVAAEQKFINSVWRIQS